MSVKSLIQEFKDFAVKGNAVDLAVGVVIGAAFGGIVNSLVNDVIMPPLGYLTGGVDFKNKVIQLKPAITDQTGKVLVAAVDWRYGSFINTVINFLIVASAIFVVIKLMSILHREQPPADPPPTLDQKLLTEIRDLLKKQSTEKGA
ncbi:MAG TPA: large-conductance mechanosensitive channel protein MscL [Tepidisphaeraceae bacterium]|nr:large-conductance mechanosensitive channel protein MscL [Tepidisphaeraceae bacterium]